jgi:hypothetical protein
VAGVYGGGWLTEFFSSNPFWLFLGLLAGGLIQSLLHWIERHRQASNALAVLKIEIRYNLGQADGYIDTIKSQRERISSFEIAPGAVYFPMSNFDYTVLGSIAQTGFFHLLLGPENLERVIRFRRHFNNDTGGLLYSSFQQSATAGRAVSFLQEEEARAKDLRSDVEHLLVTKKRLFRFTVSQPTHFFTRGR